MAWALFSAIASRQQNQSFACTSQPYAVIILQKPASAKILLKIVQKFPGKICRNSETCLKLAPSSFCVYLFGLESLVVPARDFYFRVDSLIR